MCGLTGLFRPDGGPPDARLLQAMTDALAHRGPDGEGVHLEPGVGLGHRRLAIIDPAGGHQPMYNEDRSVVIVFNGEVYNFAALRAELEQLGHVFRNRCDTEAVVHAWESWGVGCLERLEGFFALALWDANAGTLLLARDRLGKKPLHHATLPDGTLAFASELAAMRVLPGLPRGLDRTALDDFLALGYVPDPATIHRGVRKLPAAHFLLLRRGEPVGEPRRWWSLPAHPGERRLDPAATAGELRDRLREATRARLVSDVPLGAFLSGGVDSAAVVALAATLRREGGGGALDTFTIGFPGETPDGTDERPFAAAVAARYATAHHAEPAALDYVAAARVQARVFGEPFGDSSAVPTMDVCRLARRHVTVALSGDGGDEVLGGYRRHRWHVLAERARALLPVGVRRPLLSALARAYPQLDRAPRWLRARSTLTEMSLDAAAGYYRTHCKLQHDARRALYAPGLRAAVDGHDPAARFAAIMDAHADEPPLAQAQRVDLLTYLPGDILTKVDRTSMAASLEVRAPLLDHTLVAWGLSLPSRLKLRDGVGKRVLRDAVRPLLPPELLDRPKQGFAMPLAAQFRRDAARVRARLLGAPMLDSGLFEASALSRLLDEHEAGRNHAQALWQLLVLEGFLALEGGLAPETDAPRVAPVRQGLPA